MQVTKRFHSEELDMNLTPMIDVVFQLIIFFLVVSEIASYDRIEGLTLPMATAATKEERLPDRLVISVVGGGTMDKQGRVLYEKDTIIIGGKTRSLKQTEGYLRVEKKYRRVEGDTKQPVLIQADRRVAWATVQDIIEAASNLKFWRLSFSVKMPQ